MRRILSIAALMALAVQLAGPIRATENDDRGKKMEQWQQKHTEAQMKRMTKKLGLSSDQQATVKAALDEKNEKMSALRRETGTKRMAIRDDADGKIIAVLNDDQKKKFADMRADMEMKQRADWEPKKEK